MNLSGAHVLITGASRGIGEAAAAEMARRGARVTIVARNLDTLQPVAERHGAHAIATDLSDMAQVRRLLPAAADAQGPVDVLVNNAALMGQGAIATQSAERMQATLTANLLAPAELCRAAIGPMAEHRRGAILNISSLAGEMALRNISTYSTSKGALTHFTRILDRELKGTGVRAYRVLLGAVDTQMIHENDDDPVAGPAAARLAMIPTSGPDAVARRIADTVEREPRFSVVTPAAGWPVVALRALPSRFADLILAGIPRSM